MERRLAAVMATDVVGYSRLMDRDEQGTLERLKSIQRNVIEYQFASLCSRADPRSKA